MLAAYGYYKVVSSSYGTLQNGIYAYKLGNGVYTKLFPSKIQNDWVLSNGEIENIKIIDKDDTIIIEQTDEDYEIITKLNL